MPENAIKKFTHKLTDWLIAVCVALLLVWFVITLPVYNTNPAQKQPVVDSKSLKNHVRFLTLGLAPRTINYDNLNATADYIFRQFQYLGNPKYQYIDRLSKQYRNVILHLGPDTKEVYVVGAHYDAENDSIDNEGNASGVATLIELARQVSKKSYQLETGIIFVAYPLSLNQIDMINNTASFHHARSLREKNKEVNLMLSLDSVGRFNSDLDSQNHPHSFMEMFYPSKGDYLNVLGRVQDTNKIRKLKKNFKNNSVLPIYSQNLPEHFSKAQSSDHLSYWQHGYPAVLISDTKQFRTLDDQNLELIESLDYNKMAMMVDGLSKAILHNTASKHRKEQIVQRSRNKQSKRIIIR